MARSSSPTRRSCSRRKARCGEWTSFPATTPERLPFVGQDGITPAVSMPQPGQPSRLAYVPELRGHEYLAGRHAGPRCAGGGAAFSRHLVDPGRLAPGLLGRWEGDLPLRSLRRVRRSGSAKPDGTHAVQLTYLAAIPGFPRFSPDGTLVTFHTECRGTPRTARCTWCHPRAGRCATSRRAASTDTFPSFSHDGAWIYFSSDRSGVPFIWKIPVAGGTAIQVSHRPRVDGAGVERRRVSVLRRKPDGCRRPGRCGRCLSRAELPIKLVDGVSPAAIDLADAGVYYLERAPAGVNLRYIDPVKRQSVLVAANLGNAGPGLAVSRDGRTILFARTDSSQQRPHAGGQLSLTCTGTAAIAFQTASASPSADARSTLERTACENTLGDRVPRGGCGNPPGNGATATGLIGAGATCRLHRHQH